jgi:hypothetical protein
MFWGFPQTVEVDLIVARLRWWVDPILHEHQHKQIWCALTGKLSLEQHDALRSDETVGPGATSFLLQFVADFDRLLKFDEMDELASIVVVQGKVSVSRLLTQQTRSFLK